jgi:hypothetical protein
MFLEVDAAIFKRLSGFFSCSHHIGAQMRFSMALQSRGVVAPILDGKTGLIFTRDLVGFSFCFVFVAVVVVAVVVVVDVVVVVVVVVVTPNLS